MRYAVKNTVTGMYWSFAPGDTVTDQYTDIIEQSTRFNARTFAELSATDLTREHGVTHTVEDTWS